MNEQNETIGLEVFVPTNVTKDGRKRAKLVRNKKLTAEDKASFVASYDWQRMTEQDEAVWKAIFDHLDK